jgi:hypothetical protein
MVSFRATSSGWLIDVATVVVVSNPVLVVVVGRRRLLHFAERVLAEAYL